MKGRKRVQKTCKFCGNEFGALLSQVKIGLGIYCSHQCYSLSLRKPAVERFWKHVEKGGDCWTWTGGLNTRGYGQFSDDEGSPVRAHRFSYELANGKIEIGLFVLHKCDNPVCVRPDHLFLGTHQENMDDMVKKGRKPAGEEHKMSKITEKQVLEIREMAKTKTVYKIAKIFGLGYSQTNRIIRKESWKHI